MNTSILRLLRVPAYRQAGLASIAIVLGFSFMAFVYILYSSYLDKYYKGVV